MFMDFLDRNHLNPASLTSTMQFKKLLTATQQMLKPPFFPQTSHLFSIVLGILALIVFPDRQKLFSRGCVHYYFQRGPHCLKDIPVIS